MHGITRKTGAVLALMGLVAAAMLGGCAAAQPEPKAQAAPSSGEPAPNVRNQKAVPAVPGAQNAADAVNEQNGQLQDTQDAVDKLEGAE